MSEDVCQVKSQSTWGKETEFLKEWQCCARAFETASTNTKKYVAQISRKILVNLLLKENLL